MQKNLLMLAALLCCTPQNNYSVENNSETPPAPHILDDRAYIELLKAAQEDVAAKHHMTSEDLIEVRRFNPKKPYTLIVFMAADNDLHPFAWRNIKHLELIGSTEYVNVIVQLNIPGANNPTRRYVVKQGKKFINARSTIMLHTSK